MKDVSIFLAAGFDPDTLKGKIVQTMYHQGNLSYEPHNKTFVTVYGEEVDKDDSTAQLVAFAAKFPIQD